MEKIEINGDFITIRGTTFSLTDLISVKLKSLVSVFVPYYGGQPKETGKGFSQNYRAN